MQLLKELFLRGKMLVLNPKEEWAIINDETITSQELIKKYLFILAAIPAVARFLGNWIIGQAMPFGGGFIRLPFFESLVHSVLVYVLSVAGIWTFAQILKYIAPKFASSDDIVSALKLSVFSAAPYLLIGVVQIIPSLTAISFLMGLYCLYVLYTGVPIIMKTPKEKTIPLIIVSVVAAFLLTVVVMSITVPILKALAPDLYFRGL